MMFSQDEIKRRDYELQEKAIRDYNSSMRASKQEGIQEGIQSERKTIAINLLKANMPIDFISQNTGLSEQEILHLQQSLDK
jgi:predicted transposase/invertase (TIGR01784 family)